MTKQEFIEGYCGRSGVTWEWLSQYNVALPCDCGEKECKGWAMIPNDPDSIAWHLRSSATPDNSPPQGRTPRTE